MTTQDTRPIGFGIVGCGMIAENHVAAIQASNGGRLVGAASRSRERAEAFARRHDVAFFTDSTAELAAHPEVDVVCVTTPTGAHLEPVVAAAEAGKHVLVEKPLEISVERADAMIAACRAHGVKLGAVFQARFGPGARAAKEAMAGGRLGRLVLCDAYVKWYRSPDYYEEGGWKGTRRWDGGGALMNQGVHAVDLLQWLAGMPRRVSAFTGTLAHRGIEVEDTAAALIQFEHGGLGVIEASTGTWPGTSRRLELSGDAGSVVLEDDRIARWEFEVPESRDEETVRRLGGESLLKTGAGDAKALNTAGHCLQVQDMIDAIREDRLPGIDGSEGRKAVAVIEAIYQSAREGRPVELGESIPPPDTAET
ncbi:MAG: Gfo/Idh/MocA family oxidoreductase [Verrucomicrobiales bacterium]